MAQTLVTSPVSSLGLDGNWATAKLGLDKVTRDTAKSIYDYLPMLFNLDNFKGKTITRKVFSGIPAAGLWDTTAAIPVQGFEYLYDVTATAYFYANAASYLLEAKAFDLYDTFSDMATELGKSAGEKRQTLGANVLNSGFTTAGPDGVYLFHDAHPNDARIGGTQDNLVSGVQSVSVFQDAINKILDTRDPLGRPLNLRPKRLYVYPTKVAQAKSFLGIGTNSEYGTANNNRNPFSDYQIEVVPYPWFTTSTYWVMQADTSGLYYSNSVPITTAMEEMDNHGTRHDIWFACAFWVERWQGLVAGTGI